MQPIGVFYIIDPPQVVLIGEISKFDWQNAEEVSVQWSLYGMGQCKLQLPNVSPGSYVPPNVAMDVYFNKWVKT